MLIAYANCGKGFRKIDRPGFVNRFNSEDFGQSQVLIYLIFFLRYSRSGKSLRFL